MPGHGRPRSRVNIFSGMLAWSELGSFSFLEAFCQANTFRHLQNIRRWLPLQVKQLERLAAIDKIPSVCIVPLHVQLSRLLCGYGCTSQIHMVSDFSPRSPWYFSDGSRGQVAERGLFYPRRNQNGILSTTASFLQLLQLMRYARDMRNGNREFGQDVFVVETGRGGAERKRVLWGSSRTTLSFGNMVSISASAGLRETKGLGPLICVL